MADPLALFAFLPHDLRVKVPLHGKPAGFNKLDDNRQAGDSPLVLNIGKIAVIYVDNLRQGAAGQTPCFPGRFHVCAKLSKPGQSSMFAI